MTQIITMALFALVTIGLAGLIGGKFYRMRGGPPSWPRPIEQALFCSVFLGVGMAAGVPFWWQALTLYAAAVAFCLTGHGQYFLALAVKSIEPERFDFIVRLFFGADPRTSKRFEHLRGIDEAKLTEQQRAEIASYMFSYGMRKLYWRCAFGLAITGLLVSIVPGIVIAFYEPWLGLAIGLCGAIKGPAYMLMQRLGKGTEGGEWATGAGTWMIAVASLMVWMTVVCS